MKNQRGRNSRERQPLHLAPRRKGPNLEDEVEVDYMKTLNGETSEKVTGTHEFMSHRWHHYN